LAKEAEDLRLTEVVGVEPMEEVPEVVLQVTIHMAAQPIKEEVRDGQVANQIGSVETRPLIVEASTAKISCKEKQRQKTTPMAATETSQECRAPKVRLSVLTSTNYSPVTLNWKILTLSFAYGSHSCSRMLSNQRQVRSRCVSTRWVQTDLM